MTDLSAAPALQPRPGGMYQLRAGLKVFVEAEVDFYGLPHWRGILLPPSCGVILWYTTGAYSPVRGVKHELDIVEETFS